MAKVQKSFFKKICLNKIKAVMTSTMDLLLLMKISQNGILMKNFKIGTFHLTKSLSLSVKTI